MRLAFNETQIEQITTFAYQLPRHLRSQYVHHLAKLLPHDFSDADVWRAAHKAVHEVMAAATRGVPEGHSQRWQGYRVPRSGRPTMGSPGHQNLVIA
jgi:hypothetical protein